MYTLLIISTLIFLISCSRSTQFDNSDKQEGQSTETLSTITVDESHIEEKSAGFECFALDFDSAKEQADSLLAFMEKAKNSDSTNRQKWEHNFFCAFPSSFQGMQSVFGFDDEKGAAPLYEYPKGESLIQYFNQLRSIPDSMYYNKYVRINIKGVWEGDNIREAFDFGSRLLDDTKNACKALSKFSDTEIKSVFRFIFDGPHPKNEYNEKLYKKLKTKIDSQDKRLGQLLTRSFETLMAEDDGHGH